MFNYNTRRESFMRYIVEPEIFQTYPLFRRAVLVARNMNNSREIPEVLALLRKCEQSVRREELAAPYEHPRLKRTCLLPCALIPSATRLRSSI